MDAGWMDDEWMDERVVNARIVSVMGEWMDGWMGGCVVYSWMD